MYISVHTRVILTTVLHVRQYGNKNYVPRVDEVRYMQIRKGMYMYCVAS